jgi:hypothetical protein
VSAALSLAGAVAGAALPGWRPEAAPAPGLSAQRV